jgi:glycosyltransferase involved in cell wall biosynthesis
MRAHFFLDCWPMRRAVLEIADRRRVDGVFGWHHELALLPAPLRRRGVFSGMFVAGWYNHLRPSEIRDNGENAKQRWKRRAERHFLSRGLHGVDKVFAISRWSKQEAIEVFGVPAERVEVVYWGVDPIFATAQHAPAERVTRFLFYGSQNQRKGALEAMEAFARLHQAGHRDWTYKVVWLHTDKVRAHAEQLGIEDRVVPMAPMRHAELVKQLEWAQVAILPSLYESFGLACVEALTSGIPVIAYDCAGVPEVVRHGVDGWLVENGRKDLLDAPILEAMADARRTFEMGRAGRERALRDFTWPRTAAQLLELVEQGRRQQRRPA